MTETGVTVAREEVAALVEGEVLIAEEVADWLLLDEVECL